MISARTTRRKRAVESFGSAKDCIEQIEKDMSLFAVTRGQFSMLDIMNVVIQQVGPCNVSVWTWAIADYEVECMENFMQNKTILAGRLVIDRAAEVKNDAVISKWRSVFGADTVRVCKNHAKIATVQNDKFRVLIRGSMNLNFNPRFEQFDITEGGPDFDLIERLENELPILRPKCSNLEAMKASQLGLAFESSTLNIFSGIKPWAK